MTFEEALNELESIVALLEKGDVPLEEAISLFERGIELSSYCDKKLNEAEGRITMLIKEHDKFKEIPFN